MIPTAVCLLLPSRDGCSFLATSRRNSNTQWGMPGGKVDPGEAPHNALIREVAEETGFILRDELIVPIYAGLCHGEKTFWVITYMTFEDDPVYDFSAAIEHDILYEMKERSVFLSHDTSPFAEYNKIAFSVYDEYMVK